VKIFCDFDDTFARSSKRIVEMMNEDYNLNKTEDDVHDWPYRSIYRNMTEERVVELYEDDRMFECLELFDDAIETLYLHEVHFCTAGTLLNLKKKKLYLDKVMNQPFWYAPVPNGDKSIYDMSDAIQIDDRVDNLLHTNAKVKILFKNHKNHTWQNVPANSGIYVVNTWEEIKQIIKFLEDEY
jgi:hypothetical protein